MKPLGLSAMALAKALHVPPRRILEIVNERRGLNGEMVLRLARYFGMSPQFWMRMQTHYELTTAEDTMARTIRREVRPAPRDPMTGELKAVKIGRENAGPSTRSRRATSLRMTS